MVKAAVLVAMAVGRIMSVIVSIPVEDARFSRSRVLVFLGRLPAVEAGLKRLPAVPAAGCW